MTTQDEVAEFCRERLAEMYEGGDAPARLNFISFRHLAAAWSGHPDYKPEWAVDAG